MSQQWAAATTFVARQADGTRTIVEVAIGMPTRMSDNQWSCEVSIAPLFGELAPVIGADALQALGLAWALVGRLLMGAAEEGNQLEYQSGGDVPLSAYFVNLSGA